MDEVKNVSSVGQMLKLTTLQKEDEHTSEVTGNGTINVPFRMT